MHLSSVPTCGDISPCWHVDVQKHLRKENRRPPIRMLDPDPCLRGFTLLALLLMTCSRFYSRFHPSFCCVPRQSLLHYLDPLTISTHCAKCTVRFQLPRFSNAEHLHRLHRCSKTYEFHTTRPSCIACVSQHSDTLHGANPHAARKR